MAQFIHQPHDKLFKSSMSDIRVAREFFEIHLPPELLKKIDLSTLKLEKDSFIDEAFKATEADVVYTVQLGDSLVYLYILCEHQSRIDVTIAFRLLVYQVRIMESSLVKYPDQPLPIIYPLVVYTGEKKWVAPLEIFELFGKYSDLARKYLLKPYHLIEVQHLSDQELQKYPWAGLVEFVLKYRRARDFEQFLEKLFPWLNQVEIQKGENFVKIVLKYVIDGVEANNEGLFVEKAQQHLSETLRGEAMTLAQQFEKKGFQQGMQEGMTLAQQFEKKGFQQGMQEGMTLAQQFEKKGFQQGMQEGMTLAQQFEKKGFQQGMQQAMKLAEQGEQKGREQGIHHGIEKEKLETAVRLLKEGLALDFIARITQLSLERLQELEV